MLYNCDERHQMSLWSLLVHTPWIWLRSQVQSLRRWSHFPSTVKRGLPRGSSAWSPLPGWSGWSEKNEPAVHIYPGRRSVSFTAHVRFRTYHPTVRTRVHLFLHVFHLHEDLHSVQGGGTSARDGPRHCTWSKLLPPDTRALLLLCEFIWDGQTVPYVQHLGITHIYEIKPLVFMGWSNWRRLSALLLQLELYAHIPSGMTVYGHKHLYNK